MYCDFFISPIGVWKLSANENEITAMELVAAPGTTHRYFLLDEALMQLSEYFYEDRTDFSLPLQKKGTAFQRKVWAAIRDIPCGKTATYGEIARAIGSPRAARAVGMALHRNPFPVIVPCHRVVGKASPGGYAFGLPRKRYLLDLERKKKH